ncbi:MAG: nicotinate-nucleotide--dimethylbenzimidazole phosphoribosyltransferase [Deltaproteobacteria bacterium]|jgi:nicotinate-nucleotide--dimethylbenzimidazole phosphoribosyltransferase|nr:nicotinate-nucleotide--dimethylbenzimidazole phosphoribosyltransferase [Deltaproteobacteria bacterium]
MMNESERLNEYIRSVYPPNKALAALAAEREQWLAKPRGTLGRLEDLAIQLSSIQNRLRPGHENKLMVVCAGDHGVVEEGVSVYSKDVTYQQIVNFSQGGGCITVLSQNVGAKVVLLDVGVDHDLPAHPKIVAAKIARGTKNLAKGPAMTRDEAVASVVTGIETVLAEPQLDLVAAGEMGIGNTTPSSCIAAALAGLTPEEAAGRGAGLDDRQVRHKAEVIARSLEINKPDPSDPLDVLAKVGGLEIGAMAGVYIGGAIRRAGLIIDGFIAAAAAVLAEKLAPGVKSYMIAGHKSREKAHGALLGYLGLSPLLDLGMWLGEGSGAAVAMFICQCACEHFNKMKTLAEAAVTDVIDLDQILNGS